MWQGVPSVSGPVGARRGARFLILLCLACPQAAGRHRPRDPWLLSAQRVSDLHTAIVRVGKQRVVFHGYVSDSWRYMPEGTFFDGLKRVDTPDGPIFRKGLQVFTDLPDELYLRAYSAVRRCPRDLRDLGPPPADFSPAFVRRLRPEAGYLRRGRRYRVEITEVEESPAGLWPGITVEFPAAFYLWSPDTRGARLTDALFVDLFSGDGTKIGEFTIDLAGHTGL